MEKKSLLGLQDDELDKALRLTTEVDGKIYPTVTGMLLIGKESSIEKLNAYSKSFISGFRRDESKSKYRDKWSFIGSI